MTDKKKPTRKAPAIVDDGKLMFVHMSSDQHKQPEISVKSNKDWILFGEKNDYPQYLLQLFERSAKNNAIITGKCDFILGKGWNVSEDVDNRSEALQRKFIRHANRLESLDQVSKKIILDLEIHNRYALEVIYNSLGQIAEVWHMDVSKIREPKPGSEHDGKLLWSEDWTHTRPQDQGFRVMDRFDPDHPIGRQVIYFEGYTPGVEHYAYPEYIGSNASIETDIEISNFWLNAIKHGFSGGYLINFNNGVPPKEEQKKIERQIIEKHTGSDAANRFILTFNKGKENQADVIPITPNNLVDQYQALKMSTEQEIFTGHRVTSPLIFGIKTAGQLGGRTELIEATELFNNNYVDSKQMIVEALFNGVIEFNGLDAGLVLVKKDTIGFQFSEQVIATVMTDEEIRAHINNKQGIVLEDREEMRKAFNTEEDDDVLLEAFKDIGEDSSNFRILESIPLYNGFRNERQRQFAEIQLLDQMKKKFATLDITITTFDRRVLEYIQQDQHITVDQIAENLNTTPTNVADALERLSTAGVITRTEGTDVEGNPQIVTEVTEDGIDTIDSQGVNVAEIEVMYRYVTAPGIPPVQSESRDFCRNLLAVNRLYSRAEIDTISASSARNVWQRRGGFYHNPETGITTPYCRHIWQQEIVTRL